MADLQGARGYYANADVRARLREYAGDDTGAMTAVTVAGLDPNAGAMPTWDEATLVPAADLDALLDRGCDVSRARSVVVWQS